MIVSAIGETDHIENQIVVNYLLTIWVVTANLYLLPNIFPGYILISSVSSMDTFLYFETSVYSRPVGLNVDSRCLELGHLLFHQFLFLGGHIEFHLSMPFPVCHHSILPLFVSGFGMFPTSIFRFRVRVP